jgi:hypothetical protein
MLIRASTERLRKELFVERVMWGCGVWMFAGALLGPEATRCVVSGVVFENCRVDASIFVVKLLRAHGGCLGFRSR